MTSGMSPLAILIVLLVQNFSEVVENIKQQEVEETDPEVSSYSHQL